MAESTASILVVDDEPDLRTLYELTLLREGYRVDSAGDLGEARALLGAGVYDLILTDMRLPDGLGMELLYEVRDGRRDERCIVMTAYGSAENAVEALKAGAFDYLTKPVDLKQFRMVVASALAAPKGQQPKPSRGGKPEAGIAKDSGVPNAIAELERMVGESAPMRAVKQRIVRVARGMAPVLIRGESGTGKELVARALHAASQRADGPMISVNCGAIPETLLEAEFFGARKGAYTGAGQDRQGFFQAARGGTLFLDEIGELPLSMQSKLLRAIQERSVRPLGATQEEAVDVRIVSATHRDLAADVQGGRFRQDLYYRLNVIEIIIPPLRERREDLPALCRALLRRIAADAGIQEPRLTPEALQEIQNMALPGNVRELENLLHRCVALGDGPDLEVSAEIAGMSSAPMTRSASAAARLDEGESSVDPAFAPTHPVPLQAGEGKAFAVPAGAIPSDLQGWLDQQEREILIRALKENGYNRTAAAASLGISLRQIRYRIERLNIPLEPDAEGHDN